MGKLNDLTAINREEITLRVILDTSATISDDEAIAVAKTFVVGAIEVAIGGTSAELGHFPEDYHDRFPKVRDQVANQLVVKSVERGSIVVTVAVLGATLTWIIKQIWANLAAAAVYDIAKHAIGRLRRRPTNAAKVIRQLVEINVDSPLSRVTLEYEDHSKVTWERVVGRDQSQSRQGKPSHRGRKGRPGQRYS